MKTHAPCRGEIWLADLEPVAGHEQGGRRPCLIVSDDLFNHGPAGLVVVLPVTSRNRGIPLHVALTPPEGGLKMPSVIMPEMVRSVSVARLGKRLGKVSPSTLEHVAARLAALLCIG